MAETNEYLEKREIRFYSKCKIKTSFYSSPIEDEILLEMGIEPSYDLEKMVDKPVFIEKIVFDCAKSQFYDEAMTGEFFQFEKIQYTFPPLFFLLPLGQPWGRST